MKNEKVNPSGGAVVDPNPETEVVESPEVGYQGAVMPFPTPATPYYEVKNIMTGNIDKFSGFMEDALNKGCQILQVGVIDNCHYALIVEARV